MRCSPRPNPHPVHCRALSLAREGGRACGARCPVYPRPHGSNPSQGQPARAQLRRAKTDCEQRFWLAVRDRRLGGFKFRFQHSVFPHVADFACLETMVIVEIDGGQHGHERDALRTGTLERQGYLVLRFWNDDVIENMQGVLEAVLAACESRRVR